MKHLIKILMLAAACLMAAGCSGNDNDETTVAPIRIIESDKAYQYQGDSGTITFEADGPVSVSTDQLWCSTTLSGNKVTVTVDENLQISTRSANVIFTLGDYTTKVNIIQNGLLFAFYPYGYDTIGCLAGDELSLPLNALYPVEIVSTPAWMNASIDGDNLVLTVTQDNPSMENTRNGNVVVKMLGIERTLSIIQDAKLYFGYLGTWNMTYYNSSSVFTQSTVTLSIKERGVSYVLSGLLYDMVVYYVNDRLEFYTNQVVGIHTEGGADYNIIIRMVNNATTSSIATGAGMYSSYIMEGDQMVVTLHNNGVYADGTGFGFYRTVGSTNTVYAKYRTEVKLYKQ